MSEATSDTELLQSEEGREPRDSRRETSCWGKCGVALVCILCHLVPLVCVCLFITHSLKAQEERWPYTPWVLLGIGVSVPVISVIILLYPAVELHHDSPGWCGHTLNGASFGASNYFCQTLGFFKAAAVSNFRPSYAQWFESHTEEDPDVGVKFGGNTHSFYSFAVCKEKLCNLGLNIKNGLVKRESELALAVFNNMWPEVGRFALGFSNEDHAFVRPYLAEMFDNGRNETGATPYGWSLNSLRHEFSILFDGLSVLDHDLVTRNLFDVINPSQSKTVVTQMVLKVLHRVALGMDITDEEAVELAALQTTQLLPSMYPGRLAQSCCVWTCLGHPARSKAMAWLKRYKREIERRFSATIWDDDQLVLLSSAFLDAMLQAGGRSVPLAIDLVLGYILSVSGRRRLQPGCQYPCLDDGVHALPPACNRASNVGSRPKPG